MEPAHTHAVPPGPGNQFLLSIHLRGTLPRGTVMGRCMFKKILLALDKEREKPGGFIREHGPRGLMLRVL